MSRLPGSPRAVSLASLAAVAVALAGPAAVLAATPDGTYGVSSIEPDGNSFDRLLATIGPVVGIAIVIAIAIGLAVIVARVVAGIGDATRPRSPIGRLVPGVVALAAAVAGILAGREIAYERSMPGLAGALGGIIPVFLLVVAIVGLSVVGFIATVIRHGHLSRAILTLLAAASLLATGAFGGAATAAATGAVHVEPVVLQAAGETNVRLDAVKLPFATPDRSRAECRSAPDGQTVVEFATSELGELGTGTMLAAVILPVAEPRTATARFWIDAADLPDGAAQPLWKGSALILEMRADGSKGRLAFDGLSIHLEDKMPVPDPSWPSAISGELTWTCQPW